MCEYVQRSFGLTTIYTTRELTFFFYVRTHYYPRDKLFYLNYYSLTLILTITRSLFFRVCSSSTGFVRYLSGEQVHRRDVILLLVHREQRLVRSCRPCPCRCSCSAGFPILGHWVLTLQTRRATSLHQRVHPAHLSGSVLRPTVVVDVDTPPPSPLGPTCGVTQGETRIPSASMGAGARGSTAMLHHTLGPNCSPAWARRQWEV